jgi:hypothetical protein
MPWGGWSAEFNLPVKSGPSLYGCFCLSWDAAMTWLIAAQKWAMTERDTGRL